MFKLISSLFNVEVQNNVVASIPRTVKLIEPHFLLVEKHLLEEHAYVVRKAANLC